MQKLLLPITTTRSSVAIWNQLAIWTKELGAQLDVLQILPPKIDLPQMPGPGHYPFQSWKTTPPNVSINALFGLVDIDNWEITKGNFLEVIEEYAQAIGATYIVLDLNTLAIDPEEVLTRCNIPVVVIPPGANFRSWSILEITKPATYGNALEKGLPFVLLPELRFHACTCNHACIRGKSCDDDKQKEENEELNNSLHLVS